MIVRGPILMTVHRHISGLERPASGQESGPARHSGAGSRWCTGRACRLMPARCQPRLVRNSAIAAYWHAAPGGWTSGREEFRPCGLACSATPATCLPRVGRFCVDGPLCVGEEGGAEGGADPVFQLVVAVARLEY